MARKARLQFEKTQKPKKGTTHRQKVAEALLIGRGYDRGYRRVRPRTRRAKIANFILGKNSFIGYPHNRGIAKYESQLRLGRRNPSIEQIVRQKIEERDGRINVLDIGCATQEFGAALVEKFGQGVRMEGITLARPFAPEKIDEIKERLDGTEGLSNRARLKLELRKTDSAAFYSRAKATGIVTHAGLAETHDYGRKFDLIFSVYSLMYAMEPRMALANTLNHLKVGGEAFLEFGIQPDYGRWLRQPETAGLLKSKGIRMERLGRLQYHFKRGAPGELDLKALPEIQKRKRR
jgi:SAM-dependent methyltransferase